MTFADEQTEIVLCPRCAGTLTRELIAYLRVVEDRKSTRPALRRMWDRLRYDPALPL
jgi:hypothetical protein